MSKQSMREEAERLIRETMARKAIVVKQGNTRIETDLRQMRRAEPRLGGKRRDPGEIRLQAMRPQARDAVTPHAVRAISGYANSKAIGASLTLVSPHWSEISGLRWRDRREQCPVRLEVDQRRTIEAVEPLDQQHQAIARNQLGNGCTDRIWPYRRAQSESPARGPVICRTLTHQIRRNSWSR